MVNLAAIRSHVVIMLNAGLSRALTYHDIHHTLDVAARCLNIAGDEGITDKQVLLELHVAALYHDTGFMFTYHHHEEKSCEIARQQLPAFGMDEKAVNNVCDLIMATKVPHAPGNDLQEIISDADLDYLGREDFFETGDRLRLELIAFKLISPGQDWDDRQLDFLQEHRYFTKSSMTKRSPAKNKFIEQLAAYKKTKKT